MRHRSITVGGRICTPTVSAALRTQKHPLCETIPDVWAAQLSFYSQFFMINSLFIRWLLSSEVLRLSGFSDVKESWSLSLANSRGWENVSRDVAAAAHLRYLETLRTFLRKVFLFGWKKVLRQSGCNRAVSPPVLVSWASYFNVLLSYFCNLPSVWTGLGLSSSEPSCTVNVLLY